MISTHVTEAIILAGGFGTRLKHIVNDLPKPMAPVNGIPFLTYLFRKLEKAGITHIILSTGYLHEKIQNFYGNSFQGINISYSHENEPLGTGGAIKLAMNLVSTDNILILNGDTLFDIDFSKFNSFHFQHNSYLSIALREVEDVSRYGSVVVDKNDRITEFTEKNFRTGNGAINGGIYLINNTLFTKINTPEKFSFEKDLLEKHVQQFSFFGCSFNGYFIDIGVPEDYFRAQDEFPTLN